MDLAGDQDNLMERIHKLETRIEHLRVSRKVLMNLVCRVEEDKCKLVSRLEKENQRLEGCNARYARVLWEKNRRIVMLENRLRLSGERCEPGNYESGNYQPANYDLPLEGN